MKEVTAMHPMRHFRAQVRFAFWAIAATGAAVWVSEKTALSSYFDRLSWFTIEEVQIHVEWPLTEGEVRGWLPALEGKNLFSLDASSLHSLLQQKPWVESVVLRKEYPNRLTLKISTKRAEAVILQNGQPFFLGSKGEVIESVTPSHLRTLDLPVVSRDGQSAAQEWQLSAVIRIIERFHAGMDPHYPLSQVVLGTYPYFSLFLSRPNLEVQFNYENWELQLPILALLLHRPPDVVGQPQRINLVFPKKAVVSHTLSK
jgi:hypothetical protein